MLTFKSAAVSAAAVAAVILAASFHARANVPDTNYVRFSRAVSLPGVTLPAGVYIFERADENVPDIVRVLSRDRTKVYLTAYTTSIPRPQDLGNRVVLLGEATGGAAPPVRAWFPVDEMMGHQFNYDR